jgi:aspartate aminotransferase-like enzyme
MCIAALRHCFAHLEREGGMAAVQERCFQLTQYLVARMKALRHSAGAGDRSIPLCVIYGRWHNTSEPITSAQQG